MKNLVTRERLLMLGAPLALCVLILAQPAVASPGDVFGQVRPVVGWWVVAHLLELPLVILLAMAAWRLARGRQGRLSHVTRVAAGLFAACAPAVVAIAGPGTGALVAYAATLPTTQRQAVAGAVDSLWTSPPFLILSALAAAGWLLALLPVIVERARPTISRDLVGLLMGLAVAVAFAGQMVGTGAITFVLGTLGVVVVLAVAAQPRLPLALLAAAALLMGGGLSWPAGPVALLCFAAGVALLDPKLAPWLASHAPVVARADATPTASGGPSRAAGRLRGRAPERRR